MRWLYKVVPGQLQGSLQQKRRAPSTQNINLVQQQLNLVDIERWKIRVKRFFFNLLFWLAGDVEDVVHMT
jgi:hypothetical protein